MGKFFEKIKLNEVEKYLIICIVIIHFIVASYIGLSPDEAHYALYAKFIDWSYYDHPPMVGWIQFAFYRFSESELVLRIVPMLSWLFSLYLILFLTKILKDSLQLENEIARDSKSVRGEIQLFALSPMLHLLAIALVPDTLLVPLILLLMIFTWQLLQSENIENTRLRHWFRLGIILGLAGLTKYTSIFFVFPVAILLLKKFGFRMLASSKIYLACLVAFLMITPVLYWNFNHNWSSFTYQLNHASGSSEWLIRKCILFILVLLLAYGPLLAIGFSKKKLFHGKVEGNVHFFSLIFTVPFLILLICLSGRGSTLPHWAAPAFVGLIPMVAIQIESFKKSINRVYKTCLIIQGTCVVGLFILLGSAGLGQEFGAQKTFNSNNLSEKSKNNPFADLYGWDVAAETANEILQKYNVQKIAVSNWTLASRIAWYSRTHPVNVIDSRHDQFEIWFGALKPSESVLWVDWSMMPFEFPTGKNQFESCDQVAQLPIEHWGRQISHFNFSICKNWLGQSELN